MITRKSAPPASLRHMFHPWFLSNNHQNKLWHKDTFLEKKTKVTTVVLKMWYMYFSPGPEKKDWALNWRFAGSNPILPAMYDQAPNVIWVKISCVQCMCVYNDSYKWCFDALWWLPQHLAFYSEKMCLFITALNTPTSSVRWFTLSRGLRGLLPPVGH